MTPLDIRAFRCRTDNVGVLLRDPATGEAAAIDAPDADTVLAELGAAGWRLTTIFITHGDRDHVGGLAALKAATGATAIGPAAAIERVPGLDRLLLDGARVAVGTVGGMALATPGHVPDQMAFHFEDAGVLFSADALFVMGCGQVRIGTPAEMHASLTRLAALPGETRVYCGHDYAAANARFALTIEPGNRDLAARAAEAGALAARGTMMQPTTIADERRTNPFLRCDVPEVAAAVGMPGAAPLDVFTALRARKDRF